VHGGRPMVTRRLVTTGAVLVASVLAVVVVLVLSGVSVPGLTGLTSGVTTTCTAQRGTAEQDVDTDDSDEAAWARVPGQPATVYFETGALPQRYARFVEQGAAAWSRGPCVKAVAVGRCPVAVGCTTVRTAAGKGDDGETDGDSEGTQAGGVRVANAIRLYPELLDDSSDNGALVTVTHEMGHALGLRHRQQSNTLMNAETGDDTPAEPDDVDYGNLLAIYGTPAG
jgi:hypothetical protein